MTTCSGRSVSWGDRNRLSATAMFLAAALILPLLLVGPSTVVEAKAPAELLALADEQPEARVQVIAQAADSTEAIAALIEELGGTVTRDLHIINAVAAQLPAAQLKHLARSGDVNWISLDGPMERTAKGGKPGKTSEPLPENYFLDTLNVRSVRDMGLDGTGITVAVIDSGVYPHKDLQVDSSTGNPESRVLLSLTFNSRANITQDVLGHGSHVAGIIGGDGRLSDGMYSGIAPGVNLISLKVSDDTGMAYESDTVDAMQWILDNKDAYNIRVVNMSINSTLEQSYHTSPLGAAAEILWFNGIVVVTSAGNEISNFNTVKAAPANDPFVITVGAADEVGDSLRWDDYVVNFSAHGTTLDGHIKPDVIAPGKDIVSIGGQGDWWNDHPTHRVDGDYFRASGTSMSAPMVTGAVALLLQDEPLLTPDQVKFRLMNTGSLIYGTGKGANVPYRYLDVYELVTSDTTASANTGLVASQLLWTGDDPVSWNSVSWNSVSWNSVSWNSVSWNSVSWNSVSWNSVSWTD